MGIKKTKGTGMESGGLAQSRTGQAQSETSECQPQHPHVCTDQITLHQISQLQLSSVRMPFAAC